MTQAFQLPATTLATLHAARPDRATMLLLRHSARGPIPPGDPGNDVRLLPEGHALARDLGAVVGARLRSLHASPVARCVETAEGLAVGAGLPRHVVEDRHLGDPGVYVEDGTRAWETWSTLGHERVMGHLVAGDRLPGLADPRAASQRLVRHLLATAAREPGVHVFVTHDSLVTTAAAHVLGVPLARSDWPEFLEALVVSDGEAGVVARYRGWGVTVAFGRASPSHVRCNTSCSSAD